MDTSPADATCASPCSPLTLASRGLPRLPPVSSTIADVIGSLGQSEAGESGSRDVTADRRAPFQSSGSKPSTGSGSNPTPFRQSPVKNESRIRTLFSEHRKDKRASNQVTSSDAGDSRPSDLDLTPGLTPGLTPSLTPTPVPTLPNGHVSSAHAFQTFGESVTIMECDSDAVDIKVSSETPVMEEEVMDTKWMAHGGNSIGDLSASTDELTPSEISDLPEYENGNDLTLQSEEVVEDEGDMDEKEYELRQASKMLKELMGDHHKSANWPFLESVDVDGMKLWDYRERIKKPMWLKKMHEKLNNGDYVSITDVVSDFRLMLENCYRYNGPDHYISKRGQRLEQIFEQKLSLLSKSLRDKSVITLTNPDWLLDSVPNEFGLRRRTKPGVISVAVVTGATIDAVLPSGALLANLRGIQEEQDKEKKKNLLLEKRQQVEAKWQTIQQWEEDLMPQDVRRDMKHMNELPQIGLFLYLCQSALNLPELNQFDVERCCIVPRQSQSMSYIMTSLLSTPYQRKE